MINFLKISNMKLTKIFFNLLLFSGICISHVFGQASDPYVNGATVSPAPIRVDPITFPINKDPLSVSFNFGNSSTTAIQLNTLNAINVSLSKLSPRPNDIVGGNPPYYYTVSTVGGDYFSVTYNSTTNTFVFVQKAVIPGYAYETITIDGLIATGLSDDPLSPQNGLNVNVAFLAAVNPNQVNDNTSSFTYTTSTTVVPIRIVTFNGLKLDNKVELKWQTSSEVNSKYFDVEFSENASQWVSIGTVNAAGNTTNPRDYSLVHNSPVNGVNYYRLKQVDADGYFSYSNIVPITFAIKGVSINSVYPNPFVSQLKIDVSSDRADVVNIQLSDNLGRVLKVEKTTLQKGVNKISLDNLSGLAPGIYNVEVKTAYSTFRYKLKK